MVAVRPVTSADAESWLELRCALWPDGPADEHRGEIERYLAGSFAREPWSVLVAADATGRVAGFVELSIRPYAEGCRTHRVAYLEGWFVRPENRGAGVGRALVQAAERWGRDHGCTEFASDADVENDTSAAAHRALGFDEVGTIRCFRKEL